jgi:alkylated DNA nucleotide flippase Atl1
VELERVGFRVQNFGPCSARALCLPSEVHTFKAFVGIGAATPEQDGPITWRGFAQPFRPQRDYATFVVFMRMASRVRRGEWTTYGDISIAVRGDTKAARSVGRAAAAVPTFPHPERVLMDGGVINPNWHDSEGRGPDYCKQLLEEQGVTFADDRADPSRRVTWDELRRRDETEPVAE